MTSDGRANKPAMSRPSTLPAPILLGALPRPAMVGHHSSPSVVSLASIFSCTSLSSSSSSASSTGVSSLNEPLTPHSPNSPLTLEHSTSPPRSHPKGARPRPRVITNANASASGSRPISVMPTIPAGSSTSSPSTRLRSASNPDSFPPNAIDLKPGLSSLPALVVTTAGGRPNPVTSPLTTTTASSLSSGQLSAFPLPPQADHFSPRSIPAPAASMSTSQPPTPTRPAVPPITTAAPSHMPFSHPSSRPHLAHLTSDTLFPPSPSDAFPGTSNAHLPEPVPPTPAVEVDWTKLERIMGTWKASQRAKSREVGDILRKGEEERKRRSVPGAGANANAGP